MVEGREYNPESSIGRIRELSNLIDEQTREHAGVFEHTGFFLEIVDMGKNALPALLSDMPEDDTTGWWRINAILNISIDIEDPVEFIKGGLADYDSIKKIVLAWGREKGYLNQIDQ